MTKTIDDYMNDPGIINEPMAMREIHAIRLKIQDEIKGMTPSEHTAYFHNRAATLPSSANWYGVAAKND
jgi:hypothetical protein